MVVFVVHWVKRKSPWSKSVRTNGFGTQQWQTRLKNGSSPTTLRNLHTHTPSRYHFYGSSITKTGPKTPSPAPVAGRESLAPHRLEVGSSILSSPACSASSISPTRSADLVSLSFNFKVQSVDVASLPPGKETRL